MYGCVHTLQPHAAAAAAAACVAREASAKDDGGGGGGGGGEIDLSNDKLKWAQFRASERANDAF
jgi:hypothetical protein